MHISKRLTFKYKNKTFYLKNNFCTVSVCPPATGEKLYFFFMILFYSHNRNYYNFSLSPPPSRRRLDVFLFTFLNRNKKTKITRRIF